MQVYSEPPVAAGNVRPIKELVGFAKVELQPGEEKEVQVQFSRQGAAYWEETLNKWRLSKDTYGVLVATSSAPKDVKTRLEVSVGEDFTYEP